VLAVDGADVGPADGGALGAHQHLAVSGRGDGKLFKYYCTIPR
jgi:hypothetical protein